MNTSNAAGMIGAGILRAPVLQIGAVELTPIEYADQRVLTLSMVDQVHQRPDGTARRNFNENKNRLIDGDDFFKVSANEIRTHKLFDIPNRAHEDVTLLTESGYLMLVKSLSDDLAWSVQRQLVKSYFAKPKQAQDVLAGLSPEYRALVALMVDSAALKAQQERFATVQAQQQDSLARLEANQIAAIASVQSFTALGYSIYRDLGLSKVELIKLGKKASAISKKRGIAVDQVSDGRYGRVGSYHVTTLDAALEELCK